MRSQDVKEIYDELRDNFVIIGLTGGLASGCTEAASMLCDDFDTSFLSDFDKNYINSAEHASKFDSLESYRLRKAFNFYNKHNWKKFYNVKVSNLLFCLFFSKKDNYQSPEYETELWFEKKDKWDEAHSLCQTVVSLIFQRSENRIAGEKKLSDNLYLLDALIKKEIKRSHPSYTNTFQKIGNELRKSGLTKYVDCGSHISKSTNPVFTVAEIINNTIEVLHSEKYDFFVVDAFRNLYEINYFKAKRANFNLFSINAEKSIRKNRMLGHFGFKESEYNTIVKEEQNKTNNHSQNINECMSNGDVFISNNTTKEYLRYQLIKYVSLIRKPGLFTPSKDERYMQIALTARYNSGCISRQVGACVVGEKGYVLGIGWNDVPESSIPCLYRSSHSLIMDNTVAPEFSVYETSEQFVSYVRNELGAKHDPFCFKDLENKRSNTEVLSKLKSETKIDLTAEQEKHLIKEFKNPTRERALHAEENAFLQSSKVGGGSLQGSILYTTASPCQLCAKKAMQLGIARIVYIDAYPDISNDQTLRSGDTKKRPSLDQFTGAAEGAFMKLFKPIINIKDEVTTV